MTKKNARAAVQVALDGCVRRFWSSKEQLWRRCKRRRVAGSPFCDQHTQLAKPVIEALDD